MEYSKQKNESTSKKPLYNLEALDGMGERILQLAPKRVTVPWGKQRVPHIVELKDDLSFNGPISMSYVLRLCSGAVPSVDMLRQICGTEYVSSDWLLFGVKPPLTTLAKNAPSGSSLYWARQKDYIANDPIDKLVALAEERFTPDYPDDADFEGDLMIGQRIKAARLKAGLTVAQLAALMTSIGGQTSTDAIYRAQRLGQEKGEQTLPTEFLVKFCVALQMSPDQILFGRPNDFPEISLAAFLNAYSYDKQEKILDLWLNS